MPYQDLLLFCRHFYLIFVANLECEEQYSLRRSDLAKDLLYFSHETGTSVHGGCAKAECGALSYVFGKSTSDIIVCNTKQFTGHPMGVGIEDVVAIASLVHNKIPPIVNHNNIDCNLGPIQLSKGGCHRRNFALRFSAGFGSQFGELLFDLVIDEKTDTNACQTFRRVTSFIDRTPLFLFCPRYA
jgi:hypothetical protein